MRQEQRRRRKIGRPIRPIPLEPPGSVGWALVVLGITLFTFAGIASILVEYVVSLPVIPYIIMATGEFWPAKTRAVFHKVSEDEALEEMQRQEQRRKAEEATRKRIDEFLPKPDPESLKLASPEFIERMKKKVGAEIDGLVVISEKGRMFLPTRRFETAHPIVQLVFTQKLGVSADHAVQESWLLNHVFDQRPMIPLVSVPHVVTRLKDVMTVHVDPESYINEEETARLQREHDISDLQIEYLRKLAQVMVEAKNDSGSTGRNFFDITIIPPDQRAAVDAIHIVKLDSDCRAAAVRIQLPPNASEFFAEQVFIHFLKHMTVKVFGDADRGTPLEHLEDDFKWVYLWAVHNSRLSDGSNEVLLMVGKQVNSPEVARTLAGLRERTEEMQLAYEKAIEENLAREKEEAKNAK